MNNGFVVTFTFFLLNTVLCHASSDSYYQVQDIREKNPRLYAEINNIDRILGRTTESLQSPQDQQNWINNHLLALDEYNKYHTEYIEKFSKNWHKPESENYDQYNYLRVFFNDDGSVERSIIVTKNENIKNSLKEVIDQLPAISMPDEEIVRYRIMRGIQFRISTIEPSL